MGTVTNPLGSLLSGLVTGYGLSHQIKQHAMQEEAFQRQKAMQDEESSIKDIQNRMMLAQNARPVNAGTVENPALQAPASDVPGAPGGGDIPGTNFVRKSDPSRTVKYKGPNGTQEYELFTPEEQLKQQLDRMQSTAVGEGIAKGRAGHQVRQQMLADEGGGVDVPEDIAGALRLPPGQKVLPDELPGLAKEAAGIRKQGQVTLAPGAKLIDTNAAGQPKTIAESAPLDPPNIRAAKSWYSESLGKKSDQLSPQEQADAVQKWNAATMNPLDKQLKEADLKAKPFDLEAKKSTIATQALERQVKSQELELAGDPDTINMAASKYLQTGQMPALGMASGLLKGKIMGRAAEIAKEKGLDPEQIPALQDSYKAMSKSLSDLTTRKGQLEAFEKGGAKNLDNFIQLAQKQVDSGSPLVNRTLRGAARTLTGSADQAAVDAARIAAFNEVSKILSGSLGNAGVSDSARHEAEGMLSGNYTMAQLLSVSKVLRQDMKNRTGAYGSQIDEIRQQMQGLTSPKKDAGSSPTSSGVEKWDFDATGNLVKVGGK